MGVSGLIRDRCRKCRGDRGWDDVRRECEVCLLEPGGEQRRDVIGVDCKRLARVLGRGRGSGGRCVSDTIARPGAVLCVVAAPCGGAVRGRVFGGAGSGKAVMRRALKERCSLVSARLAGGGVRGWVCGRARSSEPATRRALKARCSLVSARWAGEGVRGFIFRGVIARQAAPLAATSTLPLITTTESGWMPCEA